MKLFKSKEEKPIPDLCNKLIKVLYDADRPLSVWDLIQKVNSQGIIYTERQVQIGLKELKRIGVLG